MTLGKDLVLHNTGDGIDVIVNEHGEAIVLKDAGTDDLAGAIDSIRQHESTCREVKAAISHELHARFDHEARWTLEAGDWVVSGQSPDRVTYDAQELWVALDQLVNEDLIPRAAAEAAVERVYAYKANASGINRLKKLGGAVAAAVERCAVPIDPASRRITIKRRPV